MAVRARAAGFRVDYQPAARMRHLGAGSGESGALVALMAVNRIRYMEKHSHWSGAYRAAVILHELLRAKDPIHRPALRAVLRRSSWPALLHGPNSLSDMGAYAVAYQEHRPGSRVASKERDGGSSFRSTSRRSFGNTRLPNATERRRKIRTG